MIVFIFFIILLNVVAIALTYYCLEDTEQKDKVIFIAIGIAIMYILTSIVYWISSQTIEIKEVSENTKNLITFLFVPINGILILPILAKSYRKYKLGRIEKTHFRNRGILLGILLLIVLILECAYFKDIQNGIIKITEQKESQSIEKNVENVEHEVTNEMKNTIVNEINNIVNTTEQVNTNIDNTNVMH